LVSVVQAVNWEDSPWSDVSQAGDEYRQSWSEGKYQPMGIQLSDLSLFRPSNSGESVEHVLGIHAAMEGALHGLELIIPARHGD
jgi:hypothetical protein